MLYARFYAKFHARENTVNDFILHLQGSTQYERMETVSSFSGEDQSGHFGILPGHERFITTLVFGLARFRIAQSEWRYIALPGGLLYFVDNELFISTRRFYVDDNYDRISQQLKNTLQKEEENLRSMRQSLRGMEDEMFKRLWKVGQWNSLS